MLHFMGLQRVGHESVTEQWTTRNFHWWKPTYVMRTRMSDWYSHLGQLPRRNNRVENGGVKEDGSKGKPASCWWFCCFVDVIIIVISCKAIILQPKKRKENEENKRKKIYILSLSKELEWIKKKMFQTSLCVQWLRIHILMQEAQVQLIPGPGRFHMPWSN